MKLGAEELERQRKEAKHLKKKRKRAEMKEAKRKKEEQLLFEYSEKIKKQMELHKIYFSDNFLPPQISLCQQKLCVVGNGLYLKPMQ